MPNHWSGWKCPQHVYLIFSFQIGFQIYIKYQDLKLGPWSYVDTIFKQYYWLTHIICKLINDQCIIRNHTTTKNETLTIIYVVKNLMKELFDIFFMDCQTL